MVTEVDSSWFFGFLDLQSQFLPTSDMVSSPSPHQTQVWVVRVKALQLPFWRCIVFWCDMINRVRPRDEGINLVGWFKNMKKPRQTEWFCFATLNSFPLLHHVAHHVAMFGLSPPWVHQCHQCAPTWVCHPAGSQCQCAKSRITVSSDRRIHPPSCRPTRFCIQSIRKRKGLRDEGSNFCRLKLQWNRVTCCGPPWLSCFLPVVPLIFSVSDYSIPLVGPRRSQTSCWNRVYVYLFQTPHDSTAACLRF